MGYPHWKNFICLSVHHCFDANNLYNIVLHQHLELHMLSCYRSAHVDYPTGQQLHVLATIMDFIMHVVYMYVFNQLVYVKLNFFLCLLYIAYFC